ncbi:unnamed protein product [Clonostachys solani]|uniref:ENTH domain-containing protein n=1 Tax=Clonostachys solani TaxID=160281 RepID=A0A9N9Z8M3_9HYPO|nr:unnamed protein product [Clonostachys solani]
MSDPASSATAPKGADVEVETSPEFLLGYPQRVVLGVVQDDDYPPSLDKLVEIAQMTLRTAQRHVIYQILKRCLSSTDGKWRQIFKALQVVDYCLHVGCDEFLPWASFNKSLFSDLQTDERQQYHDTLHGIRLIEKESNHILDILSRQDELLPFEKRNPSSWMFRVTLSPNPFLETTPLTSESFVKYSSLENAPSLTMPKDLGELKTSHSAPTADFEINPTPIEPINHSRDLSEMLRSRHVRNGSSIAESIRPSTSADDRNGFQSKILRRPSTAVDDSNGGLHAKLPWPLGPLVHDGQERGESLTHEPPVPTLDPLPRDLGLGISLSSLSLGEREPWPADDAVSAISVNSLISPRQPPSDASSITPPVSGSGLPSPAQRRQSKRQRHSMRSQSLMELRNNPHRQNDEPVVVDQARYINIGPLRKGSIARTRPTRSSSSLAQQAHSQQGYTPTPVNHISNYMIASKVDSISSVSDRSESVTTSREYKYSSPARYMPARRIVSDLVSDSKLETVFSDDGTVSHTSYESSIATRQRRVKREHRWKRCWELSTGTYGRVWLEESINEEERGNMRAVREISKTNRGQQVNYDRELEAMAKFSHSKVGFILLDQFGTATD